jgi:Family of unknown function (DUF6526)
MEETQTYATHRRYVPLYHFFGVPILALNVLVAIAYFIGYPGKWYAWNTVVALALLAVALTVRFMILRVQDRVIRLEERLRLQQILPADLRGRVGDLSTSQLIAMRFCDDAEAPELCRAVLNGEVKQRGEIKQRIKKWRPDTLRA